MPNGDHDFDTTIRPALDAFFAPIADQIEGFASRHNLRLTKYYHQWHQWDLTFRHPNGGVGKIDVMKESETTIKIGYSWWIDDYDEGTRSAKHGSVVELPINGNGLLTTLSTLLHQIIGWEMDQWTIVTAGFKGMWLKIPRELFEADEHYPIPLTDEA